MSRPLLACLILALALAACGRKGDLELPDGEKAPPIQERPAPEVG